MTGLKPYDVIIVGAGPAGAMLGYLLARRGVRTAILEKKALPRYKPCGGGLTGRAVRLIPFEIGPAVEVEVRRAVMSVGDRVVLRVSRPDPIIRMVMRDRLDARLVREAVRAGAAVFDDTRVKGVRPVGGPGRLRVETSRGSFDGRFLAGADGAIGPCGRWLGLRVRSRRMLALEGEIRPPDGFTVPGGDPLTARFDFGLVDRGYGWIFPKADHLSVGVLTAGPSGRGLRRGFFEYLERRGLMTPETRCLRVQGHPIPHSPVRSARFANDWGLVLGDAAGITDPITGEGIYYALAEAHLAAGVIEDALSRGPAHLSEYTGLLRRTLLRDLALVSRLAPAFFACPKLITVFFTLFGRRAGPAYLDIADGRADYRSVIRSTARRSPCNGGSSSPGPGPDGGERGGSRRSIRR